MLQNLILVWLVRLSLFETAVRLCWKIILKIFFHRSMIIVWLYEQDADFVDNVRIKNIALQHRKQYFISFLNFVLG